MPNSKRQPNGRRPKSRPKRTKVPKPPETTGPIAVWWEIVEKKYFRVDD